MKTRSPAASRICAAAVTHFSQKGYDASSLNDIAASVNIRKASLYAHFANKDTLFMELFADASEIEQDFVLQCFTSEDTGLPGSAYCNALVQRFKTSEHFRFLLRVGYISPAHLIQAIDQHYEAYLKRIADLFGDKLRAWTSPVTPSQADIQLYTQAYMGIVDSLHVKLVYTQGKDVTPRLDAMQYLLGNALQQMKHKEGT